MGRQVFW